MSQKSKVGLTHSCQSAGNDATMSTILANTLSFQPINNGTAAIFPSANIHIPYNFRTFAKSGETILTDIHNPEALCLSCNLRT